MNVSVNSSKINAVVSGGSPAVSISGNTITVTGSTETNSASVFSQTVSVGVSGGIGPQGEAGPAGEAGPQGEAGSTVSNLGDVSISGLTDGDMLRFTDVSNKWENYHETNFVDGGNF
jgi:hypothetical protein